MQFDPYLFLFENHMSKKTPIKEVYAGSAENMYFICRSRWEINEKHLIISLKLYWVWFWQNNNERMFNDKAQFLLNWYDIRHYKAREKLINKLIN